MNPDVSSAGLKRATEALHAAALGQTDWVDAMRLAKDVVGSDAAAFMVWRGRGREVELNAGYGFDQGLVQEYADRFTTQDVLIDTASVQRPWQVSDEVYPLRTWGRHPFFDLLARHRVRQVMALTLHMDEDIFAAMTFHRHTCMDRAADDFQREAVLREFTQTARDAFVLHRSCVIRARAALVDALSDDAGTAFLLTARGRLDKLPGGQSPGRQLAAAGLTLAASGLRHDDPSTTARLGKASARAALGSSERVTIKGRGNSIHSISFQPAPEAIRLGARQALCLVRLRRHDARAVLEPQELMQLFGLTPAEAQVLQLLCDGHEAKECADRLGRSVATVRTHIASLLAKMQCRRQSELIRAALRAAP